MISLTVQREGCCSAGPSEPVMDGEGRAPAGRTENDRAVAYAILRFTLGISTLLHGVTRLTSDVAFAAIAGEGFAGTRLPAELVRACATTLPFLESVLGFLIMIGLWTRAGLATGGLLTGALVGALALRGDMPGIQMAYAVVYFVLLTFRTHDRFSVDRLFSY